MFNFGSIFDGIGTKLDLPEIGISEWFNNGNRTENTGRVTSNGSYFDQKTGTVKSIYPDSGSGLKYMSETEVKHDSPTDDLYNGNKDIYTPDRKVSGSDYSPADLAYLDDQEARLRAQQGSTDRALNNGLTQLQDSFNREQSSANSQRSRALEDFQLKREDTTRAKDGALNRADTQARTLADSLRRRIGMASGSGSSAYQLAAPSAVSRQASENRGGIQENYGVNFRNLGQAEDRAKVDFESLLQDLESQRKTRESDFRSGILDKKNQIDLSLSEVARQRALARGGGYNQVRSAMAPYAGAIDSRQSEIDSLFERFRTPFNVKQVDVKAPQLRDYVTNSAGISQQQPSQGEDPFSELYRKRLQDEENNLLA